MNADDDGVVEAFTIMQMLGSSEDNIRILNAKNLVKPLNEDMVAYILDWNEHNLIRADRKVNSIYKDLLLQILPEVQIRQPKERSDVDDNSRRLGGQSTVSPRTAQVRLGKGSIGKVKTPALQDNAVISEVINLFKEVNPSYERLFGMPPQRAAADRLLSKHGKDKLCSMISFLPKSNASKYAPTITTPVQFEQKLGELMAWSQKQKEVKKAIVI